MLDPTATVAAARAQLDADFEAYENSTYAKEKRIRIHYLTTAKSLLSTTDFLLQAMPDDMPVVDNLYTLINQAVEKIDAAIMRDLQCFDVPPAPAPQAA